MPREAPAQAPFYRDPEDAEGEAIRVRLAVERVITPPLTRRQILAAPSATNDAHLFSTAQNTNVHLPATVVALVEVLLERGGNTEQRRYWKISPGSGAEQWPPHRLCQPSWMPMPVTSTPSKNPGVTSTARWIAFSADW